MMKKKVNNKFSFISVFYEYFEKHFFIFGLVALLLLMLPALSALLKPGFFLSDDGEWMIIRFSAFYQALADGQFPVRFLHRLSHGYGYPVSTFLYPGFLYFGVPIHILGFSFSKTIEIIMLTTLVGSAVFTYFWLSKLFSSKAAFVGAITSVYIPYHLYDVYKRGSVGELLALAIVPCALWIIEKKNIPLFSICISLLILSHNTLALIFLPFLVFYVFIRKTFDFKKSMFSVLLGVGLSSFFTIPALWELRYTSFSSTEISDIRQYFANLNLIGFSTVFIFLVSGVFLIRKIVTSQFKSYSLALFFFGISLVSIYLSSSGSEKVWDFLPSSLIQFPFRMLSLAIISVSFLSAFSFSGLHAKWSKVIIAFIFIVLLAFSALPFLKPRAYTMQPEGFYATNSDTTTVLGEYTPKWVKNRPDQQFEQKVEILGEEKDVSNLFYNNKKITFDVNLASASAVKINTFYYPGWEAYVDDESSQISYDNPQGLMVLSVPKGNHSVQLVFSETPIRTFANLLSAFSFIVLLYFLYRLKK